MRLPSALAAAALAALTLGAGSSGLAHAAADGVRTAQSSALLPAWAATYDRAGSREVWILPVYDRGEEPWDPRALSADINGELAWFGRMSRGRFEMTATRVLDAEHFDSQGGSSCDAAARVLAPAISRFYLEAPADAYLVALTRSSDCPYSAIGDTPGRSLVLAGFSLGSLASEHSLLHELGHNLGLPHSSGYTGATLSATDAPGRLGSSILEYGALSDVMGGAGSTLRLSAASLAALGWGEGVSEIPSAARGTYRVTIPEVSAPGPDAAVVDDPVSGIRYSFTYVDAPSRPAAGVPVAGRGIFLHEVRRGSAKPSDYGRASFSYWMPWEGHDDGASMGIGAGPGTSWVSPTGGIAMRVESLGAASATVEVRVDPRGNLTDTNGPAWPLAPSIDQRPGSHVATLRLPAAWDQSGVTGYRVTAAGAQVLGVRLPRDLVFPGGATIALTGTRALVTVVAVDGAGNSTTWRQALRAG